MRAGDCGHRKPLGSAAGVRVSMRKYILHFFRTFFGTASRSSCAAAELFADVALLLTLLFPDSASDACWQCLCEHACAQMCR